MPDAPASVRLSFFWLIIAAAAVAAAFISTDMVANHKVRLQVAVAMTGGDPSLAPPIFRKYECSGCHTIGGVPGADGKVGPELTSLSQRIYIAGNISNSSDHLVSSIVSPEKFSPHTAMPTTGITDAEARNVAAYLYAY